VINRGHARLNPRDVPFLTPRSVSGRCETGKKLDKIGNTGYW
jgi:hypothetical protein